MKQETCLCCHASVDTIGKKNGYELIECPECGFITTYPLPSLADIRAVYSRQYFCKTEDSRDQVGYQNVLSCGFQEGNMRAARGRLRIIGAMMNQRGNMLDVGCSNGIFLKVARDLGWDTSGAEINQEMREIAVRTCSTGTMAASIKDVTGSHDVVTMWEYLEHVISPAEDLESVQRLLRPRGLLCLSFPNIESRRTRHGKLNWEHVKPPEHLHYWTAKSISILLEQYGFSPIVFRYFGPRWKIEAARRLGSRSNPRTLLWPVASVLSRLLQPYYHTSVETNFHSWIRRWYEGIEIYARYTGQPG